MLYIIHMSSRSRSRSPVERPNFTPSGFLKKCETKRRRTAYAPPRDAARPGQLWTLFVYKGKDEVDCVQVSRGDHAVLGRSERCDVVTMHPSCSKEHAALQFRRKDGVIKPYLIDLESTHGTTLNGERIEPARYYELRSGDLIKIAGSSRDYVLVGAPETDTKPN